MNKIIGGVISNPWFQNVDDWRWFEEEQEQGSWQGQGNGEEVRRDNS